MGPIHTLATVQSYQEENKTKIKVFNDNFHSNFTVTENVIFNTELYFKNCSKRLLAKALLSIVYYASGWHHCAFNF
jgi:hypothetical protein